jgi:hypothetical protein
MGRRRGEAVPARRVVTGPQGPRALKYTDVAALIDSIADGVAALPDLPTVGSWYRLDPHTRTYAPLGEQETFVGWAFAADNPAERVGLTEEQLRAAGIDPADVVDAVGPADVAGSRAAYNAAVTNADETLWQRAPQSVIDELIGRGPASQVGLIRDVAQPWRTLPASILDAAATHDALRLSWPAAARAAADDPAALAVDARVALDTSAARELPE